MPTKVLSDQQFTDHTNTFHDGYAGGTRNVHTGEEHPIGSPGYVVAKPGHELTVPGPATLKDVSDHRGRMLADPAVQADPRSTQGSWHLKPGSGGDPAPRGEEVTYDAGRVEPDKRKAMRQGRQGAQRAIFDLKNGSDIKLPGGVMHDALAEDMHHVGLSVSKGVVTKVQGPRRRSGRM